MIKISLSFLKEIGVCVKISLKQNKKKKKEEESVWLDFIWKAILSKYLLAALYVNKIIVAMNIRNKTNSK